MPQQAARKPALCPCGCRTIGFCDPHRERLRAIREQLQVRSEAQTAAGRRKRPTAWQPTCCTIGCLNRRQPPTPYCDECLEGAE